MTIQKKSLISTLNTTKKAIVATTQATGVSTGPVRSNSREALRAGGRASSREALRAGGRASSREALRAGGRASSREALRK